MKIYMDNCCYNRPYDDQTHIRIHLETEAKLHIQEMVKRGEDAERFVAMIKRESFDYTLWRREYFDKMDLEQVSGEAVAYAKSHPHQGKGIRV